METTKTEVITLERGRDAKGRRLYTKERREELMAEYDTSGLTQRQFATRHGLKLMTFVTWLQHRRHGVWPAQMKTKRIKFEKLELPPSVANSAQAVSALIVTLPDGTRIEASRPEDVVAVLHALKN